MGILSNIAERAWGAVSKILSLFGRLADAKRRKIDADEQRIVYLAKQQKRDPEEFVDYKAAIKEKEKINKLEELSKNIPSGYDPNYYFKLLIGVLATEGRTADSFQLNQIYTFKYIAKSGEWYDLNPLILVTSASGSYFEGINFHWRSAPQYVQSPFRKYRFDRVQSKLYRIEPSELNYVLRIPTFYPIKVNK
jgi:hypothetical protein